MAKAQHIFYMRDGHFAGNLEALNAEGDITVQDAGEAWNAPMYATGNHLVHGDYWGMILQRNGGVYNRCSLSMSVCADGTVIKRCQETTSEGCCDVAQSAGWVESLIN